MRSTLGLGLCDFRGNTVEGLIGSITAPASGRWKTTSNNGYQHLSNFEEGKRSIGREDSLVRILKPGSWAQSQSSRSDTRREHDVRGYVDGVRGMKQVEGEEKGARKKRQGKIKISVFKAPKLPEG